MSKNEALAPAFKKRSKLLKDMNTDLQEVAKDWEHRLGIRNRGEIMILYDLGARLKDIIADEATYGSNAVEQLAEYWNMSGGANTLYNLRNLATTFTKDVVNQWSVKPMASGQFISINHWFRLLSLEDKGDQTRMLNRIIEESLSTHDLEKEIRSGGGGKTKNKRFGGRKPQTPTSPLSGLQKVYGIMQQYNNLEPVLEEHVFSQIDQIASDRVNDVLLERLEENLEQVQDVKSNANKMETHLNKNIARVKKILERQKTKAESNGHAESNGAPKSSKKKLKKKLKKRPAAATA